MSLNEIINVLKEGVLMPFSFLWNPEKRIYIMYMLSALVMAFYVYKKSKVKGSFWSYVAPKKMWLGSSAKVDYILVFFNAFVKIILIGPYLILGLYFAFYINEFLLQQFGEKNLDISVFWILFLYTIVLTVVSDFSSFIVHYAQHKISFLWEFHKIHHSATELNPVTQYRLHPVELIINNIRGIIVFGLVTGIFDYLSTQRIDKLTFIGVNVFSFIFLTFGANLRHSHIEFKYFNVIEYIFISPFQHQIHHSNKPEHYDKNMGAKFALWDWIFGTLVRSEDVDEITYGLGEEDEHYDSFLKNLYKPFVNIFNKIIK